MTHPVNIQSSFISEVRKQLPPNVSLADMLAEMLGVSRDSAYRRIRCETVLSLDEVKKISSQLPVSLDMLLESSSRLVAFQSHASGGDAQCLHEWFTTFLTHLNSANNASDKHIFTMTRDLPVFHYFQHPGLAAFKIYFWLRTAQHTQRQSPVFSADVIPKELLSKARRIWERYQDIPSTEIWGIESGLITLRQIEYCHDCGFFSDPEEVQTILDQYEQILDGLQTGCAAGTKGELNRPFHLYLDEMMITGNTLLFKMEPKRIAFLRHDIDGMLLSSQDSFCNHEERRIRDLISKASLISTSGEKERIRFFSAVRDRIAETRSKTCDGIRVSFISPPMRRQA